MQTQTTETTITTEQLEDRLKAAETELEKLKTASEDADAEANKAKITADREPTHQAVVDELFWQKKAKKVREAAEAYEREHVARLRGELNDSRNAAVKADFERKEAAVRSKFTSAIDAIISATRELDAAITMLATLHQARLDAQRQGVGVTPTTLAAYVRLLDEKLAPFHGRNSHEQVHTNARATLEHELTQHDTTVCIHLQRPAARVLMPLR